MELWGQGTVVLWHWYHGSVVVWQCGTMVLWHWGTAWVTWVCGTMALLYRDTMPQWHHGTVVP